MVGSDLGQADSQTPVVEYGRTVDAGTESRFWGATVDQLIIVSGSGRMTGKLEVISRFPVSQRQTPLRRSNPVFSACPNSGGHAGLRN